MQWLISLMSDLGIPPVFVGALGIGLLVSWAGTQVTKMVFGFSGEKASKLAMLMAFLPSLSIGMISVTSMGWHGIIYAFWTAVLAAFAAPAGYKVVRSLLRRYRPKLAAALSGDPPPTDEHEAV